MRLEDKMMHGYTSDPLKEYGQTQKMYGMGSLLGMAQAQASYSQKWLNLGAKGAQDINASTETAYSGKNNNSINKKLEAAKKYLKERK